MGHNNDVVWEYEVVPSEDIDMSNWKCWTEVAGEVTATYAQGPCPRCDAVVEGVGLGGSVPIEADVATAEEAQRRPIQVHVVCGCKFDHKKEGASGCGREWLIHCRGEAM